MNTARIVQAHIDKARNDLQAARQDTVSLWGRNDTDTVGALIDIRDILESLTRACASLAKGLEQLSHVTSVTYDESDELEPDIDDEPPPDYGPPGSGAVITEWP